MSTSVVTVGSPDLDFTPLFPGETADPDAPANQYVTVQASPGDIATSVASSSGTSKTGGTSNIGLNPYGYSLPVPPIPDWLKPYLDALLIAGAVALLLLAGHAQKGAPRRR